MVYQALCEARFRVGLYTSPHLVEVRERIVVADRLIGEEAFAAWTSRLRPVIEELEASFFEATTAIAFADFAARGAQVAVVEVGLGGRLDSTNVLKPVVAAVTNVGMDHMEYLGTTIMEIAVEKAGIAKPNIPFVIGESEGEAAGVLRDVAVGKGARVVDVPPEESYQGALRLEGDHQRRNAAVARAVLRALPAHLGPDSAAIAAGLANAWVPGRFDRRGRWIFDVAHNLAGMRVLARALRDRPPPKPLHAVIGILRDKDAIGMVREIAGVSDEIWLTSPPSAPPDRRPDMAELAPVLGSGVRVQADFDRCLDEAAGGAQTVLVCGSFHTVGDAMTRVPGLAPFG